MNAQGGPSAGSSAELQELAQAIREAGVAAAELAGGSEGGPVAIALIQLARQIDDQPELAKATAAVRSWTARAIQPRGGP